MRGSNRWSGSGNVASDVSYGKTNSGDLACNFRLAIDDGERTLTYVTINIYGKIVEICKDRGLKKGDFVIIEDSQLMNREGKFGLLTEVRCLKIIILDSGKLGSSSGFPSS